MKKEAFFRSDPNVAMSSAQEKQFQGAYAPTAVHMKKEHGKIVQDCDVYIGNEINNSSWQLAQSKWHDPYHSRWDLLPSQRKEKYKNYILNHPHLIKCLKELCGQ